jgi:polysaccharide biosynthesis protein PslG
MSAHAHRRVRLAVAALSALALAGAGPAGAGNDSDPKYTDGQLKKRLKNELRAQGLEPKGISSCRPKRGKKVMLCKWRAKGEFPGEIPYECAGKAKFHVKKKSWTIDACNNVNEPMMPLNAEAGPHPLFGYNDDWHQHTGQLNELAAGGGEIARTGLFWDAVERDPGNFDWSIFDALYSQMLAVGVRPLWVLYAAPCWAQAKKCDQGHPAEEHYDELAAFAAQAAQRYPEAVGIEVWNEPNYEIYWGGPPDPESYAEMLKQVATAIHASNHSMPVVTAGLSPHINDDTDAMAYETFLRRVYATGAAQFADAIGTHPYPNRRYTEDYLGNIRVNLFRYHRVMADFGDAGKPMWVTETGVSNTGEDESFNPEQQADALAKVYTLMRRIAHPIPVVVYHRYIDQPGHPRVKEQGYGVVTGGGQPKPAYCAMAAVREQPC